MKFSVKGIIIFTVGAMLLPVFVSCRTSKRGTQADKVEHQNSVPINEVLLPHHSLNINQKRLIGEAETWMGTPYCYGGKEKGVGADCSGFVMMVFLNALDMKLPRNSAKQAEFCDEVKEVEVRVGDLVFFATGKDSQRVSHVGIIIDEQGTFIHASSSKGVCHSSMSNSYYKRHFLMYGRVPGLKLH